MSRVPHWTWVRSMSFSRCTSGGWRKTGPVAGKCHRGSDTPAIPTNCGLRPTRYWLLLSRGFGRQYRSAMGLGITLVTGASGLLGANLIAEFSVRGEPVIAQYLNHGIDFPGVQSVRCDITD